MRSNIPSTKRRWSAHPPFRAKLTLEFLEDRTAPALVAAFGVDEGIGSIVGDLSGNHLDGVMSGASWTTSGRFGNALSFDGVNDWVTVND
ncbi:MAG: hypothetical protein L0Z62_49125, partial [Gemmataceae bacterium]|nr:hypothetical protein [Gemmataceae bacterium]